MRELYDPFDPRFCESNSDINEEIEYCETRGCYVRVIDRGNYTVTHPLAAEGEFSLLGVLSQAKSFVDSLSDDELDEDIYT